MKLVNITLAATLAILPGCAVVSAYAPDMPGHEVAYAPYKTASGITTPDDLTKSLGKPLAALMPERGLLVSIGSLPVVEFHVDAGEQIQTGGGCLIVDLSKKTISKVSVGLATRFKVIGEGANRQLGDRIAGPPEQRVMSKVERRISDNDFNIIVRKANGMWNHPLRLLLPTWLDITDYFVDIDLFDGARALNVHGATNETEGLINAVNAAFEHAEKAAPL